MKILATYSNRVAAEEDRAYLMHKGIASVVHGNVTVRAFGDHFDLDPILIAVQDLHYTQASELLKQKYLPGPPPPVKMRKKDSE